MKHAAISNFEIISIIFDTVLAIVRTLLFRQFLDDRFELRFLQFIESDFQEALELLRLELAKVLVRMFADGTQRIPDRQHHIGIVSIELYSVEVVAGFGPLDGLVQTARLQDSIRPGV